MQNRVNSNLLFLSIFFILSGFGIKGEGDFNASTSYFQNLALSRNLPELMNKKVFLQVDLSASTKKSKDKLYGISLDDDIGIIKDEVEPGDRLYQLIGHFNNIDDNVLKDLSGISYEMFDLRHMDIGKKYTIIYKKSSNPRLLRFVYEPNHEEYIVYDFRDSLSFFKKKRKVKIVEKTIKGKVDGTLYWSIIDRGGPIRLTAALFDVFNWSFDFKKISDGDEFKVIYEEKYVNGKGIGLNKINAAWYKLSKSKKNPVPKTFYAFHFDRGEGPDYFDENGNNIRKAPFSFEKISSQFSRARFHTVQHRYKAHRGVDFTGPEGRPVRALDNGRVIRATYSRGNGNYVKIDHGNYQSQYLHFQKIEQGIKRGVTVEKGQRIGYLGSTGLASGPHVCLRIWKNNRQIDPLEFEGIPFPDPIQKKYMDEFSRYKDFMKDRMDAMYIGPEIFASAWKYENMAGIPIVVLAPK